jgi:hypothetical protein
VFETSLPFVGKEAVEGVLDEIRLLGRQRFEFLERL